MEPDYTLVCDKCGVELPTTPHYAAHLRDAHGMQTSAAIKAAKVARENKGVQSYAAIKAERDALRRIVVIIQERTARGGFCVCGFGKNTRGEPFHGTGCPVAAYEQLTEVRDA